MRNAFEIAKELVARWPNSADAVEYFNGWDAYISQEELPDDASEHFTTGWGDAYAYCEMQEADRD